MPNAALLQRAHHGGISVDPAARPRRRQFSAEYKLGILDEYDRTTDPGAKGALLRREGLYSSHIVEWRRARDVGALKALAPKAKPRRRSPEQVEIERLRRRNERLEADLAKYRLALELQGKSIGALGAAAGRERGSDEAAAVIINECFEAIKPLLGTRAACAAVGRPRATHYRRRRPKRAATAVVVTKPRPRPRNALRVEENDAVLAELRSERFVDLSPAQVFHVLLDEGIYLASVSTMYRLLRQEGEMGERRRQATHPPRVRPELVARRPNAVWSWDITKLKGARKGEYYDLYVVLDIFSRYVVAWCVAPTESGELAKELIADALVRQGIEPGTLTIHADRGSSMTSHSVAELLAFLGVGRTHSRPHVSNDNPFSEAQFKTLKYCPAFPERFGSIADARAFCTAFFAHYCHEHRHSGISYHTPASVHYGTAEEVRAKRAETLTAAYAANPARFRHRRPELAKLPTVAWINEPTIGNDAQKN
ncbi:MAG: IS3 family transposase [Polaromonas sp.]